MRYKIEKLDIYDYPVPGATPDLSPEWMVLESRGIFWSWQFASIHRTEEAARAEMERLQRFNKALVADKRAIRRERRRAWYRRYNHD